MSRFKIERSGGQTFLVIQGQKGQQISEREYHAINTGQVRGLLHADVIRKSNNFKINYNISGYISLKEFLINPLNKQSFAKLLGNILSNLKNMQKAYFNYQFILLDINAAMVNPTTHEVSFVYVPITFYESGTDLKAFLLSIIQSCSFVQGENTEYVRDYIRILNSGINFSVFDLEEYIKKIASGNQIDNGIKKCSKCGGIIQPNVNFCSACGMKVNIVSSDNINGVYNPVTNLAQPTSPPPIPQRQPIQASEVPKNNIAAPQVNAFNNTVSGTFMGGCNPASLDNSRQSTGYICRIKTGEQKQITTQPFRIGKDPYNCEYCIRDNMAISRCHAAIKNLNNRWFVTDFNSTNKTFVNDVQIQPSTDVELYDNTVIRFADESFIFNIF